MRNYSVKVKELLQQQLIEWELAGNNFAGLEKVLVRKFNFDGFSVKVQFNPGRIRSSSAKVDVKSIQERACFLCEENRPPEQRGIVFQDYSILVNPFPIFPEHFTVPNLKHTPQLINDRIGEMCDLAAAIAEYTVFYNGPKCGASAPDHFHFQAGSQNFIPLENEIEILKMKFGRTIKNIKIDGWAVKDGLRNFIVLESNHKKQLVDCLNQIYNVIQSFSIQKKDEPLINILVTFISGRWRVLLFPREKHRPWQYFAEGESNILFSPASVDLGGIIIIPREKDFQKITKEAIIDMIHQVLLPDVKFDLLIKRISETK